MRFKLNQIATKARQEKRLKFTSLAHHVSEENLAKCYKELKRGKALGVDQVTVEGYGENLEDNLKDLVERLKAKRYRAQPVRRVYIPKAGSKKRRGLGIPSVEDKLLQIMLKKLLESIFEADFLSCSYGFRPNLGCHDAVNALDKSVMTKPVNYIVEVDLKGFFDHVDHYWLLRCLEERIKDPNFLWMIRRVLKSGVVAHGDYSPTTQGTPQGGNLSPLLANIYLHYVLDLWFDRRIKPQVKGYMELIRYCDDFVVCCESEREAKQFLEALEERLAKFGLEVSREKTQIVRFGRRAWQQSKRRKEKVASFNFLGFTHYCKSSRRGYFIMGHKTSKENLRRKLGEVNTWLKRNRNRLPLKKWWALLKAKLIGHYNYFGISGNYSCLRQYYMQIKRKVYKWINRRSQKKSMTFEVYVAYLGYNPLPEPRICRSLYTLKPVS